MEFFQQVSDGRKMQMGQDHEIGSTFQCLLNQESGEMSSSESSRGCSRGAIF